MGVLTSMGVETGVGRYPDAGQGLIADARLLNSKAGVGSPTVALPA